MFGGQVDHTRGHQPLSARAGRCTFFSRLMDRYIPFWSIVLSETSWTLLASPILQLQFSLETSGGQIGILDKAQKSIPAS